MEGGEGGIDGGEDLMGGRKDQLDGGEADASPAAERWPPEDLTRSSLAAWLEEHPALPVRQQEGREEV